MFPSRRSTKFASKLSSIHYVYENDTMPCDETMYIKCFTMQNILWLDIYVMNSNRKMPTECLLHAVQIFFKIFYKYVTKADSWRGPLWVLTWLCYYNILHNSCTVLLNLDWSTTSLLPQLLRGTLNYILNWFYWHHIFEAWLVTFISYVLLALS